MSRIQELHPNEIHRILDHPEQKYNVDVVVQLLNKLDMARSAGELFELQKYLLAYMARAQQAYSGIQWSLKRVKSRRSNQDPNWPPPKRLGRSDPAVVEVLPAEIGLPWTVQDEKSRSENDWEIEEHVASRVIRQLRCVGDAIAWTIFNFDRRWVISLSRNHPPGHFVQNTGHNAEFIKVWDLFRTQGKFALLCDLTSCLRIGDLVVVEGDREPKVREEKTNARARTRGQRKRIEGALLSKEGTHPLGRFKEDHLCEDLDHYIWRCGVDFRSHVGDVEAAVAEAEVEGFSMSMFEGRLVWITDLVKSGQSGSLAGDLLAKKYDGVRREYGGQHLLAFSSLDYVSRVPAHVPFSIYPWTAERRARLICDYLTIDVVISIERLAGMIGGPGVRMWMVGEGPGVIGNDPDPGVIAVSAGDIPLTLHASGIKQLCLEFVNRETFASAIHAFLASGVRSGQQSFVYENEAAVWDKRGGGASS